MDWDYSKEDSSFLKEHQSELRYDHSKKVLLGCLHFKAKNFDKEIEDHYEIEIDFNQTCPLPSVKETNGRIEQIAKKKNKNLVDLHVDTPDRMLCLCSRIKAFEYSEKFNISNSPIADFITDLIIPFFYSLSYFEKFNEYPFGELKHGIPGLVKDMKDNLPIFLKYSDQYQEMKSTEFNNLINSYIKQDTKLAEKCKPISRKIGRNERCPCGSGIKYKKCHIEKKHLLLIEKIKNHVNHH